MIYRAMQFGGALVNKLCLAWVTGGYLVEEGLNRLIVAGTGGVNSCCCWTFAGRSAVNHVRHHNNNSNDIIITVAIFI